MIALYYTIVLLVVLGLLAEHYKTQIMKFFSDLKSAGSNYGRMWKEYREWKTQTPSSTDMWKTHVEEIKQMYNSKAKKETPKKPNIIQDQILRNMRGQTIKRRPRATSAWDRKETDRILKRLRENSKKRK